MQEKLAEVEQLRREVELAREKGIASPAVLLRRAAAAEDAFLALAAATLAAPDPLPLLRANAALTRAAAGEQGSTAVHFIAVFLHRHKAGATRHGDAGVECRWPEGGAVAA